MNFFYKRITPDGELDSIWDSDAESFLEIDIPISKEEYKKLGGIVHYPYDSVSKRLSELEQAFDILTDGLLS